MTKNLRPFNFGMKLARGKYLGFLNSDDFFTENAFFYLKNYIQNFQIKILFSVLLKNTGEHYMDISHIKFFFGVRGFYSSHSTGFFIKLSAAKRVGLYNLKYKFSSDYDYFLE